MYNFVREENESASDFRCLVFALSNDLKPPSVRLDVGNRLPKEKSLLELYFFSQTFMDHGFFAPYRYYSMSFKILLGRMLL